MAERDSFAFFPFLCSCSFRYCSSVVLVLDEFDLLRSAQARNAIARMPRTQTDEVGAAAAADAPQRADSLLAMEHENVSALFDALLPCLLAGASTSTLGCRISATTDSSRAVRGNFKAEEAGKIRRLGCTDIVNLRRHIHRTKQP